MVLKRTEEMYDDFSDDYDRFVNWRNRLAFEMPFIESQLQLVARPDRPLRVLDTACSTGMHAIELARRGYSAFGADLSARMIAKAVSNSSEAGVKVVFKAAGFGELKKWFSDFDALFCLGNSLPHLLTDTDLEEGLADFGACLRPNGLLLIQNRNFDAVLGRKERWMMPEAHQENGRDWIFLRFYDFEPDGLLNFNIITLQRQEGETWEQKVISSRLSPQPKEKLVDALEKAGFSQIKAYGSLANVPFDPQTSGNLVLTARWMPDSRLTNSPMRKSS